MVAVDPAVTAIDFSAPVQVARGTAVTDGDGTRRATLLFKQGTQATLVMPDGSQQPLASINVRATEFTVGSKGAQAMPAPLPPASAYTYAAEFSADTAIAVGAREVRFSQPVPFYLENFLGFPVGMAMPRGFYDRSKAAWMPSQNGRVGKIVTVTGGLANLDITGDGIADDASSLGVDDAERGRLAALQSAGQELWRVPVTHFRPWDANSPSLVPPGGGPKIAPIGGGGGGGSGSSEEDAKKDKDNPCERPGGSMLECENQTLGERIAVTGTGLTLNYRSDRVGGRAASRQLVIPLSGDTVPQSLAVIRLRVHVAGQVFEDSFPPTPNQQTSFTWDGKDAYGRTVIGIQPVTVLIQYEYQSVYRQPAAGDTSFGRAGGASIPDVNTRDLFTATTAQKTTLGRWDARAQGLAGWTLNVHHAYDPIGGVLYLGDGSKRSAQTLAQTIVTVAGKGNSAFAGDSGPATRASLSANAVLAAPDGSFYITDQTNLRIRKVGPDGIIRTVAGNGVFGSGPDGGLAVETAVNMSYGLGLGSDGALYIAEWNASKIRRVGLDGIISTVAGNGNFGFAGDGGPAISAMLGRPRSVSIGADATLYINDYPRVRIVTPSGVIRTIAGSGTFTFGGDGGSPTTAGISPAWVSMGANGLLYIADANRVRAIKPTLPALGVSDMLIASEDGTEFYRFNSEGRHLNTLDAATAAVRYQFAYTSSGLLQSVTDADGNGTTIERTPDGAPTAITGPFGARSGLTVDTTAYLQRVTDPAGHFTKLHYAGGGLLDTLTTPRGHIHSFRYDSLARLIRDQGPTGEDLAIVRQDSAVAREVRLTTAEGRTTVYHLEPLTTGGLLRKLTDPAGVLSQVLIARTDSFVTTAGDGTVSTTVLAPDPRKGLAAPLLGQIVTQTPGGRRMVVEVKRVVTRSDSTNPLSLVSQTDSVSLNGVWSVGSYNAATRRLTHISPEGRQRFATLDSKGRIVAAQVGGLDSAIFQYDTFGRLVRQQVGGRAFTFSYDSRGRLLSTTDPLGRRDSVYYNDADFMVRRVLPD